MRFDQDRFAAFELHILQRPGATAAYSPAAQARARAAFERMSQADTDYLTMVIASALPAMMTNRPATVPSPPARCRSRLTRGTACSPSAIWMPFTLFSPVPDRSPCSTCLG